MRSQRGQSFVELVLVLPILIVLVVAVGDFGRVYASGVATEDAAREAADFVAFDDLTTTHFVVSGYSGAGKCSQEAGCTVDARDLTRAEALRRACAAVSALPDYTNISDVCGEPVAANCPATPGGFCQLVVEDSQTTDPWASTCGVDPAQADLTCGWTVHVTITYDFHTLISYLPLQWASIPATVNLVRESRYAISALPAGA